MRLTMFVAVAWIFCVGAPSYSGQFDDACAATRAGDVERLRLLLTANPGLVAATGEQRGKTLLHCAASARDSENAIAIVDILIERGANVNVTDTYGWTPLHEAVFSRRSDVCRQLIGAGADLEAPMKEGLYTPLLFACKYGNSALVSLLVEAKANCLAVDKMGWGPLHIAAANGNREVADVLIRGRLGLEGKTPMGWTPVFCACANANYSLLADLIEAGANVNAVATDGRTPLDLVVSLHGDAVEVVSRIAVPATGKEGDRDRKSDSRLVQEANNLISMELRNLADIRRTEHLLVSSGARRGRDLPAQKE